MLYDSLWPVSDTSALGLTVGQPSTKVPATIIRALREPGYSYYLQLKGGAHYIVAIWVHTQTIPGGIYRTQISGFPVNDWANGYTQNNLNTTTLWDVIYCATDVELHYSLSSGIGTWVVFMGTVAVELTEAEV